MGAPNELVIATFSLAGDGLEENAARPFPPLADVVSQIQDLDVLFLQVACPPGFDGERIVGLLERAFAPIGDMRGFVTRSAFGPSLEAVFVRASRICPIRHITPDCPDATPSHVGFLLAEVAGLGRPLALRSVAWGDAYGYARLEEALKLAGIAATDALAVIGGDFNCIAPDHAGVHEFEPDWNMVPLNACKLRATSLGTEADGWVSDRRALRALTRSGFVNIGSLARDATATVNDHAEYGEGARVHHLLVSGALLPAVVPESYHVWINAIGNRAGDHRMVSTRLDLSRVARPGVAA